MWVPSHFVAGIKKAGLTGFLENVLFKTKCL